jgi:pyruvate dehydrogenase E2 component (dihydrolipoamide acetyltransferase)
MSSNWKESQMSDVVEVKVPDIGDFKDVPVIEVLVKVGDTVKAEDSLITLESDKATMDVPSPVSGVVTELKIKVGDKVAEGTLVALVKVGAGATAAAPAAVPAAVAPAAVPPRRLLRLRLPLPPAQLANSPARPTSNAKCWCSAPAPAAIPPPSAPPTSA